MNLFLAPLSNFFLHQEANNQTQQQAKSQGSLSPLIKAVIKTPQQVETPQIAISSKNNATQINPFENNFHNQQQAQQPQQNLLMQANIPQSLQANIPQNFPQFLLHRKVSGQPISSAGQKILSDYLAHNPNLSANVKTSSPNKETVSMQEMDELFESTEQVLKTPNFPLLFSMLIFLFFKSKSSGVRVNIQRKQHSKRMIGEYVISF